MAILQKCEPFIKPFGLRCGPDTTLGGGKQCRVGRFAELQRGGGAFRRIAKSIWGWSSGSGGRWTRATGHRIFRGVEDKQRPGPGRGMKNRPAGTRPGSGKETRFTAGQVQDRRGRIGKNDLLPAVAIFSPRKSVLCSEQVRPPRLFSQPLQPH